MLLAGGVVDGVTMAAALVLGADAVWCGSRFLAAAESAAHPDYKHHALKADVGDTVLTSIYGPEWPGQPMRAILNEGARVAIGGHADDVHEASSAAVGTTLLHGQRIPLSRYSAILPTQDFDGDIEQTCLTAGQSVGNIDRVMPAAEILRTMTEEATEALARFAERAIAL